MSVHSHSSDHVVAVHSGPPASHRPEKTLTSVVVCTECGQRLVPGDGHWTCHACGASYPSLPGLVRIKPCPYYWGEIPRDAMHTALRRARSRSWREAAVLAGQENGWRNAQRNVFGPGRCDWFPQVPYHRGMRALDVGSGWGNLAFLLSQRIDEVYSLEGVVERAEFQQIRREQERIEGLVVVNSDLSVLPFAPASFDLVVLNGVLEWVGLADLQRDPRDVQLSVLAKVARILKPGGCVYIGIENRVGLSVIRGQKDHSGIAYTSLLPRRLADLVMKLRSRVGYRHDLGLDSYRTYTYTPRGYRKLLDEAGLKGVGISWVEPGYNTPSHSARFESPRALRFYARQQGKQSLKGKLKRHAVNVVSRFGLQRYLMSSVSIVAHTKGVRMPSLLERVCDALRAYGYSVRAEDSLRCTRTSSDMSARARIVYILFDEHTRRPAVVAKLPRTRKSAQILQEEAAAFSRIAERCPGLTGRRHARYLAVDGLPVLCERFFDGQTFTQHLLSRRSYTAVMDWLADFQASAHDNGQALSVLATTADVVERLCGCDAVEEKSRDLLRRWLDAVCRLGDVKVGHVPVHGDFCCGNILLSDEEVFVTDWEWVRPEGPPWEDFCRFVMSTALNTSPDGSNERRAPENLLACLQGQSVHSGLVGLAAARFRERTALPGSALLAGLLCGLASRIMRDLEEHELSPADSPSYRFLDLAARAGTPPWAGVPRVLLGQPTQA